MKRGSGKRERKTSNMGVTRRQNNKVEGRKWQKEWR